MTHSHNGLTHRQFLGTMLVAAAVGGLLVEGKQISPPLLRPLGAQLEADFLAACIRCGQCVEACPYGTLKLATATNLDEGAAAGNPLFSSPPNALLSVSKLRRYPLYPHLPQRRLAAAGRQT